MFASTLAAIALSVGAPASLPGETAAPEKLVCKRRARTGTRFMTKTCRTEAQWDAIAEDNRRALKETVDRPQIKACGPSGCD